MSARKVVIEILRYKPGVIDPAELREYAVEVAAESSVLDCLERVRFEHDSGLMYRHCCHHASCGVCACRINGEERLACVTSISELDGDTIRVEPLDGLTVVADLVVQIEKLYSDLSPEWSGLRVSERSEAKRAASGVVARTRFEDCIECGCCWSACPVAGGDSPFIGPATLAALSRELEKSPERESELTSRALGPGGVGLCERAIDCSRRCPSRVAPARHIAILKRRSV